jgi:hypothetical protein
VKLSLLIDGASVFEARLSGPGVRLRVAFSEGGTCRFRFGFGEGDLTPIDATFQAVPGRWIGAKVGLFALTNAPLTTPAHADFDYFRFAPPEAAKATVG